MIKTFRRVISAALSVLTLLAALGSFTGCDEIEKFILGSGKTTAVTTEIKPPEPDTALARRSGVYTFMIAAKGSADGTLKGLSLCSFDIDEPSLAVLRVPVNLYIRSQSGAMPLSSFYSTEYARSVASGNDKNTALEKTLESIRSLFEDNLLFDIDYYIHIDNSGMSGMAHALSGIELNTSFDLTFGDGTVIPQGKNLFDRNMLDYFFSYPGFSTETDNVMNIYTNVSTGMFYSYKKQMREDTLSLLISEIRPNFTTLLPNKNGEDLFFARKLAALEPSKLRYSALATMEVVTSCGKCSVINKSGALDQLNSFLNIYQTKVSASEFDPDMFFGSQTDKIVVSIYDRTESIRKAIYTAVQVNSGTVKMQRR